METFGEWNREHDEWFERIRARHIAAGPDCPCGHGVTERERIGLETENQGPVGLLVSILRERAAGGRY